MVQVWYPITVCTNSRAQKEIIAKVWLIVGIDEFITRETIVFSTLVRLRTLWMGFHSSYMILDYEEAPVLRYLSESM